MPTQKLYPNGSGTYEEWGFPLFDLHWSECDDDPHDGATTMITTSGIYIPDGQEQRDFFDVDAWTHGAQYIEKVEVVFVGRISAFEGKIRPGLRLGSANEYGDKETMTTSWVEHTQELARPSGGNWHWSDLADLQVGVQALNGSPSCKMGNCIQCTQVYVLVTYSSDFSEIDLGGHVASAYPQRYFLSAQASDLGDGDGTFRFDKGLSEETEAETEKYIRCNNDETKACYGFTGPLIPGNGDWETGEIGVKVKVTAVGGVCQMRLKVSASRVDSSGNVQETSVETAEQNLHDASDTVFTFTVPSKDWSPGGDEDRLRVNYTFRAPDSDPSSTQNVYVKFGTEAGAEAGTYITIYRLSKIDLDGHILLTDDGDIDLDGHVVLTDDDDVDLDGHILLTDDDDVELDGHIILTNDDDVELDGHIVLTDDDDVDLDGHILLTDDNTVDLDGHIMVTDTDEIALNGHTLKTGSDGIGHDGHVYGRFTDVIDLYGHIHAVESGEMDLDGHVTSTRTGAIAVDGHVVGLEIVATVAELFASKTTTRGDTVAGKGMMITDKQTGKQVGVADTVFGKGTATVGIVAKKASVIMDLILSKKAAIKEFLHG